MFHFLKASNINEKVAEHEKTQGSILLDVRTREEYQGGHIENSINIPVDQIRKVKDIVNDTNTPIFIYCLSGSRARTAANKLKKMGYDMAIPSGGIMSYHKKVVK